MSSSPITDDELLAYLDEMLPVDRATAIETELRESASMRQQVALLSRRRDAGGHTIGEIWRRRRLSCLSRSQLGSYLLGAADDGLADYIDFHLRTIGCRVCTANLQDLREASRSKDDSVRRRRRFFESSAGRLSTQ